VCVVCVWHEKGLLSCALLFFFLRPRQHRPGGAGEAHVVCPLLLSLVGEIWWCQHPFPFAKDPRRIKASACRVRERLSGLNALGICLWEGF